MKRLIFSLSLVLAMVITASGQTWYAEMSADTLKLGNSFIERTFLWNGGNLITTSLTDCSTGVTHLSTSARPDMVLVRGVTEGEDGSWTTEVVEQNDIHPAYLKITVNCSLGALHVRRVFRIYDDSPAIACDTWLKGDMSGISSADVGNHADRKNIESSEDMKSKPVTALLDQLHFKGQHWHARAVEFWDVTDWNNNLLEERDIIAYRKNNYRGNLLFVRNGEDGNGFFFLKEAPCSSVQLAHKGVDFIAEFGRFMVTGIGVTDKDVTPDKWTRAYSCVTGVYGEGELAALTALRRYQKNIRRHVPERDEMVMMNTWGDRSQDSKVNETFCLQELEKAARLGVTSVSVRLSWLPWSPSTSSPDCLTLISDIHDTTFHVDYAGDGQGYRPLRQDRGLILDRWHTGRHPRSGIAAEAIQGLYPGTAVGLMGHHQTDSHANLGMPVQ